MMWLPLNLLVFLITLWLLAGIVLALHRISAKVSSAPLLVFLGGLTAALELQTFGQLAFLSLSADINLDSVLIFPVLLFGILIIYIFDGTVRAQVALLGTILMTVAAAIFSILLPLFASLPQVHFLTPFVGVYSLRVLAASVIALVLDIFVLILAYQGLSNLRARFPSRLAAVLALLMALSCDALIFTLIVSGGKPDFWPSLGAAWLGKMIAGLALWPFLTLYLNRVPNRMHTSMANQARPVTDLFTSTLQFESQARYHYSLYRTLRQIGRLIVTANDSAELLPPATRMLVDIRKYRLVWMIVPHVENPAELYLAACAGADLGLQEAIKAQWRLFPYQMVFETGQALVYPRLQTREGEAQPWRDFLITQQCDALVAFPLRHQQSVGGVLCVGLDQASTLDDQEVELLQNLADDLAYALVNLKARQHQALLELATSKMNDGLVIIDLQGSLVYANPIVSRASGIPMDQILGKSAGELMSRTHYERFMNASPDGRVIFDIPYKTARGNELQLSFSASVVQNPQGEPQYWVANIRNVTAYRDLERQLLLLNRLTADLVQIHDPGQLLEHILQVSEELLQADASGIYFVERETMVITKVLTNNLETAYTQRIVQDYRGLPGDVARQTLQPVHVGDTLADPVYGERIHFMAEYGIRSLLVLPILYANDPIGALTLYYHHPRQLSESEMRLGQTLARTLAIMIQNARLYDGEQKQRQLAEALVSAAAALNSSLELDEVLDHILEQVIRLLPGKAANVMLIDEQRAYVARKRGYGQAASARAIQDWSLPLTVPTLEWMLTQRSLLYIPNTLESENWQMIAGSEWIRSYVGIPLRVGAQTVGFLNVDSEQPGDFSDETRRQLHAFAEHASIAIQNARLFTESRRRAEEMAALVAAASAVSRSLDFHKVIELVTEQMAKTLKVQACIVSSYDEQQDEVHLLVEYGTDALEIAPQVSRPYHLDTYPIIRRVLANNTPVQLNLNDPDLEPPTRQYMQSRGRVRTILMLPLMTQDRTIGLVELLDDRSERVFTVRDIALGYTLASHAATAVENARLYARLQEYAAELESRVQLRTAELQAAKENIEAILASVPDAVFVLDQNGALLQANQAGQSLLQQASQSDLNLFSEDFLGMLSQSGLPSEKAVLEVDGRFYQALSSELTSTETHFIGQVLVFRDVTRFRELDQMKTQFVSDVSHELRTPLTNLSLYLGLMSAVREPVKQKEYLDTLQRETDRLTHLIEDLLTISRLEAGKLSANLYPVSINRIIKELVDDRKNLAARQQIRLESVLDPQDPKAVADAGLLVQAISNLLTNAINYTPAEGQVTLYTGRCTQENAEWITISVVDTGVGIAPEDRPYVFDRFYRGSASRQTGATGTGLGLAIGREIVTLLGGKISVESELGEGSTFTVWLRPDDGQTR
ncbi:MAG: GAF domain-containing protein [Anaerolineales bacterium]|nr:GAF domain-containing protein [Anaerolineales bacterium]